MKAATVNGTVPIFQPQRQAWAAKGVCVSEAHSTAWTTMLPTIQVAEDIIGFLECVSPFFGSFFSQSLGSICSSQELISSLSKDTAG